MTIEEDLCCADCGKEAELRYMRRAYYGVCKCGNQWQLQTPREKAAIAFISESLSKMTERD